LGLSTSVGSLQPGNALRADTLFCTVPTACWLSVYWLLAVGGFVTDALVACHLKMVTGAYSRHSRMQSARWMSHKAPKCATKILIEGRAHAVIDHGHRILTAKVEGRRHAPPQTSRMVWRGYSSSMHASVVMRHTSCETHRLCV
jgi:hypothetical protein